ncbi:uncharacterized protein N7477_005219 [Penicillium maclennaniae]|uniref:uncharacterized protein n=1 Tax=Penicillium maclennaniae TaxID=1343394 RepID=UPI002541593A|nr:uncharacterized protein N7477_005219 [Penicillium maclennaniae]KAJ5675285.1 hypothetical protein N7477_005219 [Penicillium maclennaniae]
MLCAKFLVGLGGIVSAIGSYILPLQGQELRVRYSRSEWITPGMTLVIEGTKSVPQISSYGLHCQRRYLLLMLDPDVQIPGTGIQCMVLHWYQPDLVFDCKKVDPPYLLEPDPDRTPVTFAPYIAPQAPPLSHHRYIFLLFEQPPTYHFPKCFEHIPPKSMEARGGFDIKVFMQAASLGPPVAINYFFGRLDASKGDDSTPVPSVTTTSFRSLTCDTGPTGSLAKIQR